MTTTPDTTALREVAMHSAIRQVRATSPMFRQANLAAALLDAYDAALAAARRDPEPVASADAARLRAALAGVVVDHFDDGHTLADCTRAVWHEASAAIEGAAIRGTASDDWVKLEPDEVVVKAEAFRGTAQEGPLDVERFVSSFKAARGLTLDVGDARLDAEFLSAINDLRAFARLRATEGTE